MIVVFSGTGNSLFVARRLASQACLNDRLVQYPDIVQPDPGEPVIWVFPVYSWGVPPVVVEWIGKWQPVLNDSGLHYAVMTCGDDCGLTARQWRRMIEKSGCTARAAFSVQMPNTYVLMKGFDTDSNEVAESKIAASESRVNFIAGQIGHGLAEGDHTVHGSWAWVKSAIVYPWFKRFAMSPEPFRYGEDCVGCSICARACPLGNITMCDKRPHWGDHCALCLRCFHICPRRAVAYGKATRGKSRYTSMLWQFNVKD